MHTTHSTYDSAMDTSMQPQFKRRSRAKRHLAWERAQEKSNGLYAIHLHQVAERYPTLTPMELRISALIRSMLLSWEIAEILNIEERTVESHRMRIRRKLGLGKENLVRYLIGN